MERIRGIIFGIHTLGANSVGGGGGTGTPATTLRMSHIAAGRQYLVLLDPATHSTDANRRLHLHTFSDSGT